MGKIVIHGIFSRFMVINEITLSSIHKNCGHDPSLIITTVSTQQLLFWITMLSNVQEHKQDHLELGWMALIASASCVLFGDVVCLCLLWNFINSSLQSMAKWCSPTLYLHQHIWLNYQKMTQMMSDISKEQNFLKNGSSL